MMLCQIIQNLLDRSKLEILDLLLICRYDKGVTDAKKSGRNIIKLIKAKI